MNQNKPAIPNPTLQSAPHSQPFERYRRLTPNMQFLPSRFMIRATLVLSIYAAANIALAQPESPATIPERVDQLREIVEARIKPKFDKADAPYPPKRLVLYGLKKEQRLQIFAPDKSGRLKFIYQYPVAAVRTKPGPKLAEGDLMTPEGIYKISFLNPNSMFWLGMEINYPNAFDKKVGKQDDRENLGTAIVIHGNWFSDGCLAMGNTAIEDIFTLSALTGKDNIKVILVPHDLRNDPDTLEIEKTYPKLKWLPKLYDDLRAEVNAMENTGTDTELALMVHPDSSPPQEEGLMVSLLRWIFTPQETPPATSEDLQTSATALLEDDNTSTNTGTLP